MRIKAKLGQQYRRYFSAIYVCENCGQEEEKGGYDDGNFHHNVVLAMKCENCGKSRSDLGIESEYVRTKYSDWMQI